MVAYFVKHCLESNNESGHFHYVGSLGTLGAVFDGEFNFVAFSQALVALHADRGKVDKNVLTALARDKTVTLGRVEPLDRALDAICHNC